MDTVAIDVGSAFVDLAKWDGRELQIEKLPTANPLKALPQWLALLKPSVGFDFRYHTSRTDPDPGVLALFNIAADCGASRSTYEPDLSSAWTAFRGARWFADRHRMDDVLILEGGAARARCAVVNRGGLSADSIDHHWGHDATGRVLYDEGIGELAVWLSSRQGSINVMERACCGGVAPALAASFAARTGSSRALVPDYAGCMGALGLILCPETLQVDSSWVPRPIDAGFLREMFSKLMDELGREITSAGYDFDEVICQRYVRFIRAGAEIGFESHCGPSLREIDFPDAYLRSRIEEDETFAAGGPILMREAVIRAAVDTRQWEFPPPQAVKSVATQPLDDRCVREIAPVGDIVERNSLLPGAQVLGPAVIRDRFHLTTVPEFWKAEVSRAGGVMLYRVPGA